MKAFLQGKEVIPYLAEIYYQLYVAPGMEGAEEMYKAIVKRGESAYAKELTHFTLSDQDKIEVANTPAGEVKVVTLHERHDFEIFLQIMANRCAVKEIPATQGASIIDGIINWRRIEAHRDEFIKKELEKGVDEPDWSAEFSRFTADKSNYLDAIIVLSVGPYSGITAAKVDMSDDEWLGYSDTIRKYHECTHFICRRLYREKIDPIWDEIVADAVGIFAAFGRYDAKMAELFLGIDENGYCGGRLENYVDVDKSDTALWENEMEKVSKQVHGTIMQFSEMIEKSKLSDPFEIAIMLEESK